MRRGETCRTDGMDPFVHQTNKLLNIVERRRLKNHNSLFHIIHSKLSNPTNMGSIGESEISLRIYEEKYSVRVSVFFSENGDNFNVPYPVNKTTLE